MQSCEHSWTPWAHSPLVISVLLLLSFTLLQIAGIILFLFLMYRSPIWVRHGPLGLISFIR